jgi:hypothetical protein
MQHEHIPGVPEHEGEPVPGLPERLPAGEGILWQGSPSWWPFTRRAMHLRGLAFYFLLIIAWQVTEAAAGGAGLAEVLAAPALSILLALGCLGILALIGRASAKATLYTITNRRIVMRVGVALPMTINLPFAAVKSAAVRRHADGTEDIVLDLMPEHRVSAIALWPHLRPWRMGRPAPMLRGLPVVSGASQVLARALAASASRPVEAVAPTPSSAQDVPMPGAAVA